LSLRPLCLDCGFQLAAKIGTKIVACILCGSEFDLIKKNQGLDEFLRGKHDKRFGGNEISQQNKEDWK
jgi:hypothetical protein